MAQVQDEEFPLLFTTIRRYVYEELQPDDIRLLHLYPGTREDDIHVDLRHVSSTDEQHYLALSYAWGEPIFDQFIYIDYSYIKVTESLYSALWHLRDEGQTVILWADAVCIDQNNTPERNYQVQIMASIFGRAQAVLVWLGDENSEVESRVRAWDLLQNVKNLPSAYEKIDIPDSEILGEGNESQTADAHVRDVNNGLKALNVLCSKPWFERLWVVQESAVAKKLTFVYGDHEIESQSFLEAALTYHRCLSSADQLRAGNTVMWALALLRLNQHYNSGELQPEYRLLDFLTMTFRLKTSDERDRVFAGRALAAIQNVESLRPNYSLSPEDLWRRVTLYLLTSQFEGENWMKSFVFAIPGTQNRTTAGGLPSWAANFAALSAHTRNKHILYELESAIRHAGGKNDFMVIYDKADPLTLRTRCTVLGEIEQVLSSSYCPIQRLEASSKEPDNIKMGQVWISWLRRCRNFCGAWHERHSKLESANMLTQGTLPETVIIIARPIEDFGEHEADASDIAESQRNALLAWDPRQMHFDRHKFLGPDKDHVQFIDTSRVLASTSDGRMGWIPESAKIGDHVILIQGAPFPFVVRQHDDNYFTIIGDAYIHGVMNGEAWPADGDRIREIAFR